MCFCILDPGWIVMRDKRPIHQFDLKFNDSEHGCFTACKKCYWKDLHTAKRQCGTWKKCKFLFQADMCNISTTGTSVYWAFPWNELKNSTGDVVWMRKRIYVPYASKFNTHTILHYFTYNEGVNCNFKL